LKLSGGIILSASASQFHIPVSLAAGMSYSAGGFFICEAAK